LCSSGDLWGGRYARGVLTRHLGLRASTAMVVSFSTYGEFWPFYLGEHLHPVNRRLHFAGTSIALALIIVSVIVAEPVFLLAALFSGYGFAWFGHYFIEKNRPATFRYPMWSFVSDWRMWLLMLFRRPLI